MTIRKLKSGVRQSAKFLFFHAGVFSLIRAARPAGGVAILRYHAVVDPRRADYASPMICISPAAFEAHVRYFVRRYKVISLDHAVAGLKGDTALPGKAVVFTFDDGYADNYVAGKILRKYGATGTIYLTAACIDRQEPFWLAEVTHLPLTTQRPYLEICVGEETYRYELQTAQQRWRAVRELVRLIKSNDLPYREEVRQQLRAQLAAQDHEKRMQERMLSWEQIRKMQADGLTFGAHTMTHLNLPNAHPTDAEREIRGSKNLLEEKLGCEIRHFSYPNSGPYEYYTPEIRELVAKCGFASAVTSSQGFAAKGEDLLSLRRLRTVPSLVETVSGIELEKLGA